MWWASLVLAMARETHGWSERHIFWEMRYCRLLQYYHAALRVNGAWTVAIAAPGPAIKADDFDALLKV